MAKFEKGNKLGKGRPRLPDDIKAARQMNQIQLERILNHVAFMPVAELNDLCKAKDEPAFVVGAAKIVQKVAKYGDVWAYNAILDRLIGRPRDVTPEPPPDIPLIGQAVKRTFSEFCAEAKYPVPYPKQIEMVDFLLTVTEPRLLLGARGYGKTDYDTILGVAYDIYMNPEHTWMIITKEKKRSSAIIVEIASALKLNGVELDKENSSCIRVKGHQGKDHSVDARSIRSGLRGPHPYGIVMDDPVTEEDVSQATRELVERKYNEAFKLTSNILIIGQPAHAMDLYAKLRPLLRKLEVPHGTIPELDHDLEAQRLAGVDEKSIQASYHLNIVSDGSMPFEKVNYIDRFPPGDCVAWLDPSHKGRDFTALSIVKQHFQGVAAVGFVRQRAWNHCLDDFIPKLRQFGVRKLCVETNGLGDQPVLMLRQMLAGSGIGVVGKDSVLQKHAKIMAAGAYAHLIHLSKESDRAYTDQVVQYEYQATNDDGPDSLASCLEWIGLIRGKA
jgi:hypothetical protein